MPPHAGRTQAVVPAQEEGRIDLLLDRMIAECQQHRSMPALPSFGRALVPYFMPGAGEDPGEEDINASLDQPVSPCGGKENSISESKNALKRKGMRGATSQSGSPAQPVNLCNGASCARVQTTTAAPTPDKKGSAEPQGARRSLQHQFDRNSSVVAPMSTISPSTKPIPMTGKGKSRRRGGKTSPTASDPESEAFVSRCSKSLSSAMVTIREPIVMPQRTTGLHTLHQHRNTMPARVAATATPAAVSTSNYSASMLTPPRAASFSEGQRWAGMRASPPPSSLPLPSFIEGLTLPSAAATRAETSSLKSAGVAAVDAPVAAAAPLVGPTVSAPGPMRHAASAPCIAVPPATSAAGAGSHNSALGLLSLLNSAGVRAMTPLPTGPNPATPGASSSPLRLTSCASDMQRADGFSALTATSDLRRILRLQC